MIRANRIGKIAYRIMGKTYKPNRKKQKNEREEVDLREEEIKYNK